MPGQMSDGDRQFLVGMTPDMSKTKEGRQLIIDSYVALFKRDQDIARFMRNYEQKYGRLDNGFFDQLAQWSNANTLFRGK